MPGKHPEPQRCTFLLFSCCSFKCNILLIYTLENKHVLKKIVVGKFISFWDGPLFEDIRSFSGGVFDLLLPQAVCHFRLALTDVGRRVRHRNGNISSDRLPSQAGSHRIPRCQNPERERERKKLKYSILYIYNKYLYLEPKWVPLLVKRVF